MSTQDREAGDFFLWVLGFFIAAVVVYVVAYFALARPGIRVWFVATGQAIYATPTYRGLPKEIFEPIHYLDRTYLRPKLWGQRRIWTIVPAGTGVTNAVAGIPTSSLEGAPSVPIITDSAPPH